MYLSVCCAEVGNGGGREIWERTKGNGVDDLGMRRGREAHKEQKTRGERDWKGRLRWQAIPISSL